MIATKEMPQTLSAEDGAIIPPKNNVSSGLEEPKEPSEADLFWTLYHRNPAEMSDLDQILEKHGLPAPLASCSKKTLKVGAQRFISAAKRLGLIQEPKPLSLRQYIGALLPISNQ